MAQKTTPWDKQQVKTFVKDAKSRIGNGWRFMVPEVQAAMIRSKALAVVTGQARETIPIESIDWLVAAMLTEAGLNEI